MYLQITNYGLFNFWLVFWAVVKSISAFFYKLLSVCFIVYCIRVEKNNPNKAIIYFEGWLWDDSKIEKDLYDILNALKNKNEICVDLLKVKTISDDVLKILQQLKEEYPLRFQNYSLYIEILLSEYNLLESKGCVNKKLEK